VEKIVTIVLLILTMILLVTLGCGGEDSDYAFFKTTGGSIDVLALSAQQTADGGYIVAGYASGQPTEKPEPLGPSTLQLTPTPTRPPGANYQDLLLLKYDRSGSLSWARTASLGSEDLVSSVRQTADGGYILAGYTSTSRYEGRDVLLLKYNSAGVLEWARTTGGSNDDIAQSVWQTADGGYVVAGETRSYGAGLTDVLLLKYDSAGTLEWARTAGGSYYDDALSVQQTADGGYVVAGSTSSYGMGYEDVFLLKYDSEGTLSWAKTTGGNDEDMARSVQQTADGGYIVAGWTGSYGAGDRDVLVLRYDNSGMLEWARTTGGSSSDDACAVQQTTDGGYVVAGTTVTLGPVGSAGISLLKYDSAGTLEWARTAGGGSADVIRSMQQTTDGGYIVTGFTSSYGAGDVNVFLFKTDEDGYIRDCSLVSSASPSVASPNLVTGTHNVSTSSPIMSTDSPDVSTSSLSLTADTICTGEGFTIYLTKGDISPAQMPALSHIDIEEQPLIALSDIITYYADTHHIALTASAYKRISELEVPVGGKSFVVCVNRKPIYWGAFWTPISSVSFDGVTIWKLLGSQGPEIVKLELGYPSSSFYEGEDPRNNAEVMESLEQAGKLTTMSSTTTGDKLPHSAKGYDLYYWAEDGQWHFTLITGTNRLKYLEEIVSNENIVSEDGWVHIHVVGIEAIETVLSRLPQNEYVGWVPLPQY
jgi:hypothetical protein